MRLEVPESRQWKAEKGKAGPNPTPDRQFYGTSAGIISRWASGRQSRHLPLLPHQGIHLMSIWCFYNKILEARYFLKERLA